MYYVCMYMQVKHQLEETTFQLHGMTKERNDLTQDLKYTKQQRLAAIKARKETEQELEETRGDLTQTRADYVVLGGKYASERDKLKASKSQVKKLESQLASKEQVNNPHPN
jgi:chromosome segregation ATPase